MDNLSSLIRKLAKSRYYQTIYSCAKEMNIKLFKNDMDFTSIQIDFLRYLAFYSSIYMDIALNEVDEKVLDNEIYEDSYQLYKVRKDNKKSNIDNNNLDGTKVTSGINWNFKSKPPIGK